MNLHKISNSLIRSVNPNITATVRRYAGFTVGPGRSRVPSYHPDESITIQFQPLTKGDLQHVDGLNMQVLFKSIHVNGSFYSVNREMQKGGDLFIVDGQTWLVIEPLELWPDWSRLLVCLQVDE
ncbi:TPA: hypothetical protein SCR51_004870 [Citrobacter freundii]|nr:hypothetical protein [Citrobacter freundii]HCL6506863.1 hypothetical protein [Citrobacter freundii]HEG1884428.1 hypothetical protein [Citrobacter freundii]